MPSCFRRTLLIVGALAGLATAVGAVVPDAQDHADTLVEAERAFSRLSGRIGHIPAFLAYFADDVVTFQPGPGSGKERLRESAAKMPVPPAVKLDWEPWFAGAAAAGDLGYTTGPTILTDASTGKVVRTGWYFSIWKRDANGWRVAADVGTEAPPVVALRPRTVEVAAPSGAVDGGGRTKEGVLALEREFADAISQVGPVKAYARYLQPATRLHRDKSEPMVGEAAIAAYLAREVNLATCRAVDGGLAKSGDLAYTFGECDLTSAEGAAPPKAGFLRVWKSGPRGWWLAADVVTR